MTTISTPKIESITIISGRDISSLDRANAGITEDEFVELRVVRNSPKKIEIKPIKKGVKPTDGFREAIAKAGLLNQTFS